LSRKRSKVGEKSLEPVSQRGDESPADSGAGEGEEGDIRLQRWMGHHSAGFTLDTYGHLIDGDLGPGLDIGGELEA
jgi:hypothetical protein